MRIARALVAKGKVHPTSGSEATGKGASKGASIEAAKTLIAGLRRVSTPSVLGLRPALPKKEKEARLAAGIVPLPDEPPRRDEVEVRLVDLIDDAPLDAFKEKACAMIVALMAEMGTSSLVARSCYARLADEFDPPAPYLPKRPLPERPLPERPEPPVSEPPVSGRSSDGLASGDPARVRALSCEDVGVLAVELALYEVCSMVMQANDMARPTRVTRRAEALAASRPVARRASRYDAPKDDKAKDDAAKDVAKDLARKGAATQDVVSGPIDDAPRDDAPRDWAIEVARPNEDVNELAAR